MTPTMRSFFAVVSLLVLQISTLASAECDQCFFTDEDAADCKVYGQLGDRVLIAWNRASQACLDEFQIKDQAIDPATLEGVFPNSDGSGANVNTFVNYLKFNSGSVVNGLKLSFSDFFDENDTSSGVVFKDSIVVDGTTYDCEASETACYNALKIYFAKEPGASEMQDIGVDLYNQAAVSLEKEQSLVRIRLCAETSSSACEPLATQVNEQKTANPDKFCSAFGLGPAGTTVPGCEGRVVGGSSNTTTPTSAAYYGRPFAGVFVGLMASIFCGALLY